MEWTFNARGKPVTITSIDSLRAVFPTSEFSATATLDEYRSNFGDVVLEEHPNATKFSSRDRRIFERAGWWFVAAKAEVAAATAVRAAVPNARAASDVYVTASGAIMLGTNLATLELKNDLSEAQALQILQEDGLTIVHKFGFAAHMYEVRIPDGMTLPEAIKKLDESGRYLWVEPTLLQTITPKGEEAPGDPRFEAQWQHRNKGPVDGIPGVAGEDLDSLKAWAVTRGDGVRIAVIDCGMQINHPDLEGKVVGGGFFRTSESGEVDFSPIPANPADFPDFSHGTFCMGLAAARTNAVGEPGQGGCGSAPDASLIAIACPSTQLTSQATLARAVHFAVNPGAFDPAAAGQPGADVISCSLDTDRPLFNCLAKAIHHAGVEGRPVNGETRGIPIFWAVNNNPGSIDDDPVATLPEVIAVGRYDRRGLPGLGSSGEQLEFLAPGNDVFSTRSQGVYGFGDGTSFATALAAGVGALVLAVHREFTAAEVRQKLRASCEPVNQVAGHHDAHTGFGKLNAFLAVS
jgi:subtilisin family serine protease